jgi:hypothetical protein
MTAVLVPIVIIALAVLVLVVAMVRMSKRREEVATQLTDADTPSLSYHVPVGHDPAVPLAALHAAGFTASVDPVDSRHVRVWCPAGADRDRARVRAVIESADATTIDDGAPAARGDRVRFDDEV